MGVNTQFITNQYSLLDLISNFMAIVAFPGHTHFVIISYRTNPVTKIKTA